jgi:hypothetical protein
MKLRAMWPVPFIRLDGSSFKRGAPMKYVVYRNIYWRPNHRWAGPNINFGLGRTMVFINTNKPTKDHGLTELP